VINSASTSPQPGQTLLNAALDYAARGIAVFPCQSENKRPHTSNGFKDASKDPVIIERWWQRWPDAMIATPTGSSLGAWVLDVDDPEAFEAACTITLPVTRRCKTGKGYHLHFAWDEARPVRNSQRSVKGWPFPGAGGSRNAR
jgi:hypothetical protein